MVEVDDFYNPVAFATAAVGLLIGALMLKFGGLSGLGLLGKLGLIVGSTVGGFIAGLVFFRN